MEGTVFGPSLEGMKLVKSEQGEMLTKPFLEVCKMILPVLDKFGVFMSPVKTDIGGNITRLENKYLSNPTKFKNLYSVVPEEADGLLWLTRFLWKDLEKFHGWFASSSFKVAMTFAPDRKKFMEVIGGSGDVNADMEKFCTAFSPLLEENHKFLASVGMNDQKA